MLQVLSKDMLITRVMNEVAAGTTEQKSTVLDMSDYDSVLFIVLLGTVTSTSVITATAKENTASSTSSPTPVAVTGGATTALTDSGGASSNDVLLVDVIRPSLRYVFLDITRTTANCEINGVIAIQYRSKNVPVTQGAGVLEQVVSTPEV